METSFAFDAHELWRPSIFATDLENEDSIFASLQSSLKPSLFEDVEHRSNLYDDAFALPSLDFSGLPDDLQSGDDNGDLEEILSAQSLDVNGLEQNNEDVWDFEPNDLMSQRKSGLFSWEQFSSREYLNPSPAYLSELGNSTFDAYLQRRDKTTGVLPQDVMLQACASVVLGRSSLFFQWNSKQKTFSRTIHDAPVSGSSTIMSDSVLAYFMNIGAVFRTLSEATSSISHGKCATFTSFKRCVATILTGIEHHLSYEIRAVRSILQLQWATQRSTELLDHLDTLLKTLCRARDDDALIGSLSDHVSAVADNGNIFCAVFRAILLEVSTPWLQRIAEDVGLCRSIDASANSAMTADTDVDMAPRRTALIREDDDLIRKTRTSFRLLRQHMPSHPLAIPQSAFLAEVVGASTDVTAPLGSDLGVGGGSQTEAHDDRDVSVSSPDDMFIDMIALPELEVFRHEEASDGIAQALKEVLTTSGDQQSDSDPHSNDDEAQAISNIDLLGSLRPAVQAHAQSINAAVLSDVFITHKLREHFSLHRAFHLFGNGNFVNRLSTALFSDDVQSAERKRGNVPTAQTMGLRLGSRDTQRWPPASSELRLTLMGVLTETYDTNDSQAGAELPGGLSFAIRELSDAEIEQVMDTTSIHALDFLRLQYSPPDSLAAIFTQSALQKYDSIFRTLLVHVRMLHITSQLAIHSVKRNKTDSTPNERTTSFAWKARQFVTALTSHFIHVAIGSAWARFEAGLDEIDPSATMSLRRSRSERESGIASIEDIALLHEHCLEDIRSKMFLRRRHEKVKRSIDSIFDVILKAAAQVLQNLGKEDELEQHDRAFDLHFADFNSDLKALGQKLSKDMRGRTDSDTESDIANLLLARLQWRQGDVSES